MYSLKGAGHTLYIVDHPIAVYESSADNESDKINHSHDLFHLPWTVSNSPISSPHTLNGLAQNFFHFKTAERPLDGYIKVDN